MDFKQCIRASYTDYGEGERNEKNCAFGYKSDKG